MRFVDYWIGSWIRLVVAELERWYSGLELEWERRCKETSDVRDVIISIAETWINPVWKRFMHVIISMGAHDTARLDVHWCLVFSFFWRNEIENQMMVIDYGLSIPLFFYKPPWIHWRKFSDGLFIIRFLYHRMVICMLQRFRIAKTSGDCRGVNGCAEFVGTDHDTQSVCIRWRWWWSFRTLHWVISSMKQKRRVSWHVVSPKRMKTKRFYFPHLFPGSFGTLLALVKLLHDEWSIRWSDWMIQLERETLSGFYDAFLVAGVFEYDPLFANWDHVYGTALWIAKTRTPPTMHSTVVLNGPEQLWLMIRWYGCRKRSRKQESESPWGMMKLDEDDVEAYAWETSMEVKCRALSYDSTTAWKCKWQRSSSEGSRKLWTAWKWTWVIIGEEWLAWMG